MTWWQIIYLSICMFFSNFYKKGVPTYLRTYLGTYLKYIMF